ncbi:MAG: DUF1580 domain-containing protein [Planctomycetaceae bacterium]|nr:DUF1580 domain-containing protein [Planctomycetaceae bacterium]
MTIDIQQEKLITLRQAVDALPPIDGKRPRVNTIWRWCRIGIHGVRLEYIKVGRNIVTSLAAMNRFFVAVAKAEEPLVDYHLRPKPRVFMGPASRLRAIRAAQKRLEEAGI